MENYLNVTNGEWDPISIPLYLYCVYCISVQIKAVSFRIELFICDPNHCIYFFVRGFARTSENYQ